MSISLSSTDLTIVVLAGGMGKRMHSNLPKVLNRLGNQTLIEHVLTAANKLNPLETIVVIPPGQQVIFEQCITNKDLKWVTQTQALGTAHALQQALPYVTTENVLVLYGDVPMIKTDLLISLIDQCQGKMGIITALTTSPYGYGRIVRDSKQAITAIVEQKDCDEKTNAIQEINTGIGYYPVKFIKEYWKKIDNNNKQKEFYLTDYIKLWAEQDTLAHITTHDLTSVTGINTLVELNHAERLWQQDYALKLMQQGVYIADPQRFDCRGNLEAQPGSNIDINCIINGKVSLGKHSKIGANCVLENVTIGENVTIKPFTILRNTQVESHAQIGPFTFAKDQTHIASHAQIGSFVEAKCTYLGSHSKANHLAYLGNLRIQERVNIGAGVIHCNYNGIEKFTSTIQADAFIGANTNIIGPAIVENHATIGAGSTISKKAPAHKLTLSRSTQKTVEGWLSPRQKQQQTEQDSIDN